MMISKRFTVDLETLGSTPIVHAIQNDGCVRGLEVRLRRGGRPYRIPEDARVVIRYKKLNGKGGEYDTLADGTPAWFARADLLTVALTPQMLTLPGSVNVTVSLYQNGMLAGLFPVLVYVEGSANALLPDAGEPGSVSGFWPAPEKAVEGQFLRVAAVDGAGNVTALDTAEASSCPDWNQNEEAKGDYIKNRPFYTFTHETDTVGWDAYCDSITIAEGTGEEITLVRLPAEVSLEQLLGGLTLRITLADGTAQEFSDFEGDGAGTTVATPIDEYATNIVFFDGILGFYISADGYTLTDEDFSLTFPKAGLWLYSYFDYIFPGCRQEFIFRSGLVTATAVCQISGKYIPPLPYIHEGERENFATPDAIVGRRVEGGGELFNSAQLASGLNSHAEGGGTQANGEYAHAEGYSTKATGKGSHAEGFSTEASLYGHAEGYGSKAYGTYSHAEGYYARGDGLCSHGEGYESKAEGHYSHAEGRATHTRGYRAHAEGYGCHAYSDDQHVQGKYNVEDSADQYAHIVGNGSSDARSNAHTLDWEGNAWFAGKIRVGGTGQDDESSVEIPTKTEIEEMIAEAGIGSGSGTAGADGKDGGYYIPSVSQVDKNTMKVSFMASKDGMEAVADQDITLPAGAAGSTPNLTIGTVTTLEAGESATAVITGTAENPVLNLGIPKGADGAGVEADTETVLSDNLLDLSLLTQGQVFYYGGSGYQLAASTYSYYGFIPLRGAGTYRTKFQASVHSSTSTRIALVNDNDEFVVNATGTLGEVDADNNWVDFEFTVTQTNISAGATKVAFDVYSLFLDKTMIVKDREYPSEYIPYGYIEVATDSGQKQDNILCGKTAVFLGDSICAGTTVDADSGYYGYGWGGMIGEANHMIWKNYGKNGGVITPREAVSESYWISKYADTAASEYPTADYVIFEGGCNDADQMKDSGLGEISSDYAAFDTTTFSGALESLILKILTTWPTARVGYIIPQKMYTGYSDYTAANHIHRKYFERAIEICKKWGVPYLDIWNGTPLNPKLSTSSIFYVEENGQHLTLAGYQRITPQIEAFMRSL